MCPRVAERLLLCGREIVVVWQRDCCCIAERLLLCGREIVVVWQRDCCVAERLLLKLQVVAPYGICVTLYLLSHRDSTSDHTPHTGVRLKIQVVGPYGLCVTLRETVVRETVMT